MLQGIGVSRGCGIGRALVAAARAVEFTPRDGCDPALERARLAQAEAAFTAHNKRLAAQVRQELGQQESEILFGPCDDAPGPVPAGADRPGAGGRALRRAGAGDGLPIGISRCFPAWTMR